jgi:sulfopyruvate decarboxylase TPP-binding subunit
MTNTISGSDAVLKVIESWGVDHIYGYPGGSFDSTMNALHNQQDQIKFIQVRHEEAGALAAAADAKLSVKSAFALVLPALVRCICSMGYTMPKSIACQSLQSSRKCQART